MSTNKTVSVPKTRSQEGPINLELLVALRAVQSTAVIVGLDKLASRKLTLRLQIIDVNTG